ncbi:sensor histidine kinase [Halalkalibacter alkalisediminis]|uniref:histidine kinase n=1 Tax=Halalkalibacter alkalisediminis TaxID=935616 RepID=A0ABV6NJH7_9BACI|nr:sensor histidine kinase [Halalkalibacter alkalisediminis]
MSSFWVWLLLLVVSWGLSLLHFSADLLNISFRVLGSAGFFALFFLSPLLRNHKFIFTLHLSLAAVLAVVVLWPEEGGSPNLHTLVVFSILAGKAVYRLNPLQAGIVGFILTLGAIIPYFYDYPTISPTFVVVYASVLAVAFAVYKRVLLNSLGFSEQYEALLNEYRKLKRRIASDEKQARQEERAEIARQIHDSVGHKLTALLMQLEVVRMKADDETTKDQVQGLKLLAKESLEETRSAVKALKQDDVGGLAAIISLIRKLEAESFVRVSFSIKHGALTASLRNEQAIAVYRAVQEALTNMMRHSGTREVHIVFEAPAGSVFRFEVSNPTAHEMSFREGFGLSSMRERMERVGGRLEVTQYDGWFIVRGTLPLNVKERLNG